ncbi:ABC transporter ATP-binding protein [Stakelama tenebrarum]|uniref:ATP-binding cassette domain-containing protein n=1 Tax=Stakelama tenebrarum TaxID=2711215 RepID=A0A6G6Y2E7_9SPHN|nr:ATP-binding cassette domain-containing protein [Sphingosinithalassobacter tenebrarum]QIG78746.1 ATP-binding cassette domain-containing protein [Sphingosinithalassobacter tenebrarum]
MTALLLDHVTKRFGSVTAVDDLSFSVPRGQVYGFLGGNGAGKTTSLRMVLDIIRPTSGRIEVLGKAPGRENSADLGFLPEERGLYKTMSAIDTIVYFGRLKGMTASDARAEGEKLLARFDLSDFAKTNVDKLSKGMAQKVQLATAVVNKPSLLILDEPFSGLDPVNQGLLEDEIRRAADDGATVIFSTHVMQHAERLCDRLLLIAKGAKRFEGTLEEARAELPPRLTIVSRETPAGLPGVVSASEAGAAGEGWTAWSIEMEQGRDPGDLLEACTARGFALRGFEQHKPSLHDVFIHIVGAAPVGEVKA